MHRLSHGFKAGGRESGNRFRVSSGHSRQRAVEAFIQVRRRLNGAGRKTASRVLVVQARSKKSRQADKRGLFPSGRSFACSWLRRPRSATDMTLGIVLNTSGQNGAQAETPNPGQAAFSVARS
jgi:hypothetical protein